MSKKRQWVGRVYLGSDATGRQQFEWVGRYPTKRERDEAVTQRRAELKNPRPALPSCDEYVDRYLTEYERRHKRSSLDAAKSGLKRFRNDFAGRPETSTGPTLRTGPRKSPRIAYCR